MKLAGSVQFTNEIQPICLSNVDEATIGRIAIITGWVRLNNSTIK
jgi:hypothetical protein